MLIQIILLGLTIYVTISGIWMLVTGLVSLFTKSWRNHGRHFRSRSKTSTQA